MTRQWGFARWQSSYACFLASLLICSWINCSSTSGDSASSDDAEQSARLHELEATSRQLGDRPPPPIDCKKMQDWCDVDASGHYITKRNKFHIIVYQKCCQLYLEQENAQGVWAGTVVKKKLLLAGQVGKIDHSRIKFTNGKEWTKIAKGSPLWITTTRPHSTIAAAIRGTTVLPTIPVQSTTTVLPTIPIATTRPPTVAPLTMPSTVAPPICSGWPIAPQYGCSAHGTGSVKLSSVFDLALCRDLCGQQTAVSGALCCEASQDWGCYAKPGSTHTAFRDTYSLTCTPMVAPAAPAVTTSTQQAMSQQKIWWLAGAGIAGAVSLGALAGEAAYIGHKVSEDVRSTTAHVTTMPPEPIISRKSVAPGSVSAETAAPSLRGKAGADKGLSGGSPTTILVASLIVVIVLVICAICVGSTIALQARSQSRCRDVRRESRADSMESEDTTDLQDEDTVAFNCRDEGLE